MSAPQRAFAGTPAGEPVSRAWFEQNRGAYLARGRSGKADVWYSIWPGGQRVVVKDFSRKRGAWRLWGRVLIRREAAILERLASIPEVPALLAVPDPLMLAESAVTGTPLFRIPRDRFEPRWLEQLDAILQRIHGLGVVHNDLRARDNTLIDLGTGQLSLVDWAAGVYLRPGSLLHRAGFDRLRLIDCSALVKWRSLLAAQTLSESDREFLRRYHVWRFAWPFNRKGVRWRGGA